MRCICSLSMFIDVWRGGDETKGLVSPDTGRFIARSEGLAPGCKLELRRGDPTWPKADAPGDPDSKPPLYAGCDLPQRDWNREGEDVAPFGDPILRSDAVGDAPSLDMEARCENEFASISAWSREKRRIFSCGVSRSLSEFGSKSSSNLPIMSESSHSSSLYTGRAPTLEDMMPRERFAASSECSTLLPTGCSTDSGGDDPSMTLLRDPSPNAESWRFRIAAESTAYEDGGEPARNLAGTDDAIGPYRAMWEMPWLSNEAGSGTSMTLRPFCTGESGMRPFSFGGEP